MPSCKNDLLLLDEPTNHLDAESILWLEHFLHNYQGAVLAVTHDRYFLDNVAEWICEVDRGHLYPYKGNYSTYLETKAARIEAQGNRDAKLAKRMEAEARASQKLDWTDIRIPVGPRLGNKVLEAHHLHKEFDGRVLIDSWTIAQVKSILKEETYIGHSVHNKQSNISFKNKKKVRKPQEE